MDDVVTLRAFRVGRGLRQVDIADGFPEPVTQARVSVVERHPVPLLRVRTVADYVAAAGGRLLIGAEIAGGVMVPLYWRPAEEIKQ